MSEKEEEFGTPERPDRPRQDGQGSRGDRSESSREQRPNRYGVPRDGQSRPRRDDRSERSDLPRYNDRSERPRYGDRDGKPREGRPYRPSGDRPQRNDRPRYGDRDVAPRGDRPYRPTGDRPTYGDRPQRSDRPRYGDRDGAPRGDRPYRPSQDRPRYGDRDGGARESRPYRPSSDRPSYGDRGDRNSRPERGSYGRGGSNGSARGERPGSDRNSRPPYGDRPGRSDRPSYGDRSGQSDRPRYSDRDGAPRGDRPYRSSGDRPAYGERQGRPERSDRSDRGYSRERNDRGNSRENRRDSFDKPRFEERELTEQELLARRLRRVRPEHIDPPIDDDVTEALLDKGARNELKTLTKENADFVAEHLVMATRYLDSDPELAHQHVISASRRAGRIAIVRETLGITAYATGDFALALRELRTYRRISGSNEQIALMVDSERGVGRPDRALELGRSVDRSTLSEATQVALAIAMSGARLDQDQVDLALAELEIPQLDPSKAFSYSPDLFRAYAEVLEELGRHQEAAEWMSCADIAEKALIEAEVLAGPDSDMDDMLVYEEDGEEDAEATETENEETDSEIDSSEDLSDVLEDDVREILAETAHLDTKE